MFDDDEWIRSLTEGQAITADIPTERITHDQSEVDSKKGSTHPDGRISDEIYVSRRLLALSEGEIAALTAPMRQLGVGSHEGAEVLATFHQLIFDEWASGTPDTPLTRIKVDEKCFGLIQWSAVRRSSGWLESPIPVLCGARRSSTDVL